MSVPEIDSVIHTLETMKKNHILPLKEGAIATLRSGKAYVIGKRFRANDNSWSYHLEGQRQRYSYSTQAMENDKCIYRCFSQPSEEDIVHVKYT